MRLFIGIPLAASVIEQLDKVSMRHRAQGDGLRWSTRESWHITLQFLGGASESQYECLVAQLRELHAAPVSIELNELGYFDRAGIFFVGVALTPELLALQQRVTKTIVPCGFVPEDRAYRPHITLARTKGRRNAEGLEALKTKIRHQPKFSRFVAQEFLLYESFTRPTGSQYEIRERFPLSFELKSAPKPQQKRQLP
ncbi:MAG TPA: RNA 2',3'-cyclic phosphodiesterase [Acidobacteriaceae bacterium]|nr:RNA 2',3'-cyclic phosphodiesterase [Acidobacteriaceae bacterium]